MGTVPTMMASMRYGYKLIGISNVESETNDLWVRPDSPLLKTKGANPQYPNIYGTADDWKGKKILGPTVTTAHYALSATLQALGLSDKDVNIVHMELGQAMTAFNAGEGDIIMLWAPRVTWPKPEAGRRCLPVRPPTPSLPVASACARNLRKNIPTSWWNGSTSICAVLR